MMFTSPMKLLAALALSGDADAIAKELLRLGALELVSLKELSGDWKAGLSPSEPRISAVRIAELRARAELFMAMAQPPIRRPDLDASAEGASSQPDLDAAAKLLDTVAADVNGLRERQKALQDEILKLEEIRRQIEAFDDLKAGAAASSTYSFLTIRAGLLAPDKLERLSAELEGMPSVLLPSDGSGGGASGVVLVAMKRDAARIEPLLERMGWEDARLPDTGGGKAEAARELSAKVDALRARQADCGRELQELFGLRAEKLASLWAELRVAELTARLRSSFSTTERTVLFSGWIPAAKTAEVERGIRGAARGPCSIEWLEPRQGEAAALPVPVEMRNPEALKPFEGLVRNYAVPEYGSVDPTPFVAVAYLSMFGLMFGDAGHGLVVALLGLFGIARARRLGKPDGLFKVMAYCGAAAIVAGALFGSYFGFELLPPLWFDYHAVVNGHEAAGAVRSIYDILGITIRFGMAVLGLGFLLNWINLIRKRDWFTLIMDKGGFIGGWIYGAGAWVAFYFVAHDYKGLPPTSLLALVLGIPSLLLAAKGPLEFILRGRRHGKRFKPGMVMDFFMEWIVELLEIYSGYLANTLSFMRVAGLGIAHVSLMTAFFQIARMISPAGPLSPAAIAVLVLGNALVISLEGLSAGIQSLRLNYYEFFSRYFNGSGKAYRPISLRYKD
jgi:V/A-type H+/Na+-transporting ATPase subunit I